MWSEERSGLIREACDEELYFILSAKGIQRKNLIFKDDSGYCVKSGLWVGRKDRSGGNRTESAWWKKRSRKVAAEPCRKAKWQADEGGRERTAESWWGRRGSHSLPAAKK